MPMARTWACRKMAKPGRAGGVGVGLVVPPPPPPPPLHAAAAATERRTSAIGIRRIMVPSGLGKRGAPHQCPGTKSSLQSGRDLELRDVAGGDGHLVLAENRVV